MNPTAPPVNRGRSGTYGARNSAMRRRNAGTNGPAVPLAPPHRPMPALPPPPRTTRNGACPGLELPCRLCHEHTQGGDCRAPVLFRTAHQLCRVGVVDEVINERPVEGARERYSAAVGATAGGRRVDEQVPRSGPRWPGRRGGAGGLSHGFPPPPPRAGWPAPRPPPGERPTAPPR